jgi:glutamate-ammonia-ligase adenylyltransferase
MRHEPQLGRPAKAALAPSRLQTTLSRELHALLQPGAGEALFDRLAAAGLGSLAERITLAPALARHLAATPELADRLIDGGAYAPLPPPSRLKAEFAGLIEQGGRASLVTAISDYRFRLGLQLIEAAADPLDIAMTDCDLAEAGFGAMADDVMSRMKAVHGEVRGGELVILALGRFGGRLLPPRSELDIIYLFTGDHLASSDGPRPLAADEYFSRVAEQINMAMSTATPAGPLYEIGRGLRPWGARGMLACSTDIFRRCHGEHTAIREQLSLTRARPIYGSPAARAEVDAIVRERLRRRCDRAAAIGAAHDSPARGPFDPELVEGGLRDLEFVVQVHQLTEHAGLGPRLGAAIRAQVAAGLADSALVDAHHILVRMLVVLRLLSPHHDEPAPGQRPAIARACGFDDWEKLTRAYQEARASVRQARRSLTY